MSKSSNTSVLGCLYLVPNTLGEEDRVVLHRRPELRVHVLHGAGPRALQQSPPVAEQFPRQ